MKVSILASGSSGNVTYIETNRRKILVDAGLTGKKVEQLLSRINRKMADIDTILVTHEHIDHIKGVGVLARKYGIDVYANEKTWQAMAKQLGNIKISQKHIFEMGKTITFGDLDIKSFGVSHDAAQPQFYAFQKDGKEFVMLTDTGYTSQKLLDELKGANMYLMESNHDIDLLRAGSYPWATKQRILGDKGHLSNEACALALSKLISDKTQRIYLGHLSSENNLKSVARQTNEFILKQKHCWKNSDGFLMDTDPNEPTHLVTVF